MIIAAIDIFAMGYVAVAISDFIPVRAEVFPYDAMIITREENVGKCENLITQYSGRLYTYPMIRITDWYNYEHVGISEDVYRKLGGTCEELGRGEVVISRQNQHAIDAVSYDAGKSADQYGQDRYFYPGKYRYDYGWDDIFPEQGFGHINTEHRYDIRELKVENIIGQWLVDEGNMAESLLVFSNSEFESMRKNLYDEQDEPNTLILCKFPAATRNEALHSIEQNAPVLCPADNTTDGQRNWYTSDGSASEIMRYRMGGFSEMTILLLVMMLSAAVQLIIGNISEQTYLEDRMLFLDRLGYPRRIIKNILCSQYRLVPYFALIVSVMGACLMRLGYISLQHDNVNYYNDTAGKVWLISILAYIILRVITTELFVLLQRSKLLKNLL